MSFRRRLTLVSAVAVAIAVALASGLLYVVVRGRLIEQVDRGLRRVNPNVYVTGTPDGFSIKLPPPSPESNVAFVQVVGPGGQHLVAEGEVGSLPITNRTLRVARGQEEAFYQSFHLGGAHIRVLTRPIEFGAFLAAASLEDVDHTLAVLRAILLAVAVGGIVLAALLGFAVTRTALRPVRRLTEATERVTRTGDLRQGIEATGSDEISRLAASFNRMLEALDASLGAQRQLVADASHELRTPLTSLRTNVEVLARGGELPEDDQARLVRDTVAQLDEMTALIADLVDLARDSEPHHEAQADVALDELAARAMERAERRLPAVRFVADLHPCLVRGTPERLERAVANLLDNAAKWSPPGGTVEMSLEGGELAVRDHGPGIDPEDLPRVFDRFYRAASARGLPGSGLGLAIVKQVAESHGGTVVAGNAEGGGAVFRLRLPASPSAPVAPPRPDRSPSAKT